MNAMPGVGDARDAVATAAAWAGVRERDVFEVLTGADLLRANLMGRLTPAITVVATLGLHFALASPGEQTLDHQTIVLVTGMLVASVLVALVVLLLGHRGTSGALPPPPDGDLDHAALQPLLNRDNVYRLRRAGGVGFPAMMGLTAHVVFLLGHVPTRAPANVAALTVVGLVGLYVIFTGPGQERLARDIAGDIAGLVAEAGA